MVVCDAILREKHDLWEQINEIVTVWFDSQTDPMWETIVKALICMEKQREAKKLAEETGVDYEKLVDHSSDSGAPSIKPRTQGILHVTFICVIAITSCF